MAKKINHVNLVFSIKSRCMFENKEQLVYLDIKYLFSFSH